MVCRYQGHSIQSAIVDSGGPCGTKGQCPECRRYSKVREAVVKVTGSGDGSSSSGGGGGGGGCATPSRGGAKV